jgi:CRISPR system Cascade subunit CasA
MRMRQIPRGIQAAFYQQVDHRFRGWLRELGPDSRRDDVLADWSVVLRTTATGLAKDLLSAQGPDVWAGRWDGTYRITGAVAVERLRRGLRDCLGTDPRSTTSENGESK